MKVHNSENVEYTPNQQNVQQTGEQKYLNTIFSDKNNNEIVDAFDFDNDEKIVKQMQEEGMLGKLWKDVGDKINKILTPSSEPKARIEKEYKNGELVARLHYWEGEQEPFMKETIENGKAIKRELFNPPIILHFFYEGDYLIREEEGFGDDFETIKENGEDVSVNFGGDHIVREFDISQKYTGGEPLIDREPIRETLNTADGLYKHIIELMPDGSEKKTEFRYEDDKTTIKQMDIFTQNSEEHYLNGKLINSRVRNEDGSEIRTEYAGDRTTVETRDAENQLLNSVITKTDGTIIEVSYNAEKQYRALSSFKDDIHFIQYTLDKILVKSPDGKEHLYEGDEIESCPELVKVFEVENGEIGYTSINENIKLLNGEVVYRDTRDANNNGDVYDKNTNTITTYKNGIKVLEKVGDEIVYQDSRDVNGNGEVFDKNANTITTYKNGNKVLKKVGDEVVYRDSRDENGNGEIIENKNGDTTVYSYIAKKLMTKKVNNKLVMEDKRDKDGNGEVYKCENENTIVSTYKNGNLVLQIKNDELQYKDSRDENGNGELFEKDGNTIQVTTYRNNMPILIKDNDEITYEDKRDENGNGDVFEDGLITTYKNNDKVKEIYEGRLVYESRLDENGNGEVFDEVDGHKFIYKYKNNEIVATYVDGKKQED